MGRVNFEAVQKRFPGRHFVNGEEIPFDHKRTYGEQEAIIESKTHYLMRETAAHYFQEQGLDVCTNAIGIAGVYTFADLFVMDDENFAFVECLTTCNSTKEVVQKKLQLRAYGQVWLVFVGNTPDHEYPLIIDEISDDIPIYLYTYGNYKNRFKKNVSEFCYNLKPEDDKLGIFKAATVKFDIERKIKYMYVTVSIPLYARSNRRLYSLLYKYAIFPSPLRKYKIKKKMGKPMNISDLGVHSFKFSDLQGVEALEAFIVEVGQSFTVDVDFKKIEKFKDKINR